MMTTHPRVIQKTNINSSTRKLLKNSCKTIHRKTHFTLFREVDTFINIKPISELTFSFFNIRWLIPHLNYSTFSKPQLKKHFEIRKFLCRLWLKKMYQHVLSYMVLRFLPTWILPLHYFGVAQL